MPSVTSVDLANLNRKNLPNIMSMLSMLEPASVLNGTFKFFHKEQAHNVPVSHRYHQIQPVTTVSSTFFTSTSNFIDFNFSNGYRYDR